MRSMEDVLWLLGRSGWQLSGYEIAASLAAAYDGICSVHANVNEYPKCPMLAVKRCLQVLDV